MPEQKWIDWHMLNSEERHTSSLITRLGVDRPLIQLLLPVMYKRRTSVLYLVGY